MLKAKISDPCRLHIRNQLQPTYGGLSPHCSASSAQRPRLRRFKSRFHTLYTRSTHPLHAVHVLAESSTFDLPPGVHIPQRVLTRIVVRFCADSEETGYRWRRHVQALAPDRTLVAEYASQVLVERRRYCAPLRSANSQRNTCVLFPISGLFRFALFALLNDLRTASSSNPVRWVSHLHSLPILIRLRSSLQPSLITTLRKSG